MVIKNRVGLLVTLAVVFTLTTSACGVIRGGGAQPDTEDNAVEINPTDDLVAQNIVFVLVQLEGLNPKATTINIPVDNNTGVSAAIYRRIRDAGYITRLTPSGKGNLLVTTKRTDSGVEAGEVLTHTVSIGAITMSRPYRLYGGSISPDGAMRISDANKSAIVMNDDIFGLGELDPSISRIEFDTTSRTATTIQAKSTFDQLIKGNTSSDISTSSTANMFDSMESSYTNTFQSYEDKLSITVMFGNDSMALGKAGKLQIKEFAASLNQDTDLISVIGCSHGSTNIKNGNEVLALGRANRVKEEFMYAGVPEKMILDEGCWAPDRFDEVMPARGVLVTLKRSIG